MSKIPKADSARHIAAVILLLQQRFLWQQCCFLIGGATNGA
jgi:hypothetical protein